MPHLVNRLPHARGKKFSYADKEYEIGHDGVVKDVEDDHAQHLLLNKQVWMPLDQKLQTHSVPTKRVALIDDQGRHFHKDTSALAPSVSGAPLLSDSDKGKHITHDKNHLGAQTTLSPLQGDDPSKSKDIHQTPVSKGVPELEASMLLGDHAAKGNQSPADMAKDDGSPAVDGADDADKDAINPRKKRR